MVGQGPGGGLLAKGLAPLRAFGHSAGMPRLKLLSDDQVLYEARRLFASGGDRALSFGALSRATGLAASTLAQRFGSIEGLQAAAASAGWRQLLAKTEAAAEACVAKGPQGWLKALEPMAAEGVQLMALGARSPESLALARAWRARVEGLLALRLGQNDKALLAAQVLFLTWQGQMLWAPLTGDMGEVKLKDLAKRLI